MGHGDRRKGSGNGKNRDDTLISTTQYSKHVQGPDNSTARKGWHPSLEARGKKANFHTLNRTFQCNLPCQTSRYFVLSRNISSGAKWTVTVIDRGALDGQRLSSFGPVAFPATEIACPRQSENWADYNSDLVKMPLPLGR